MNVPQGYVPAKEATKVLRCKSNTLRVWADAGKIKCFRLGEKGSHRYYDLKTFLDTRGIGEEKKENQQPTRRKICYCRVSTRNQKDDLERQVEYLKSKYPDHELIKDIGSGINFKRKGLKTILEYAHRGEVDEVVVAHKDRLCRFGFDLVDFIIREFSNGKIVVLDRNENSPQSELVQDVLAILTVFSARINGLRKYKTQIKEEHGGTTTTTTTTNINQDHEDLGPSDPVANQNSQAVVRDVQVVLQPSERLL